MLVSIVRNAVIVAPFVDADESTYAEVPQGKELEIRAANAIPGTGALVELRTTSAPSTNPSISETEAVGEQLDALDSITGWAAGTSTAVALDTTVKNEGTGSLKLTVTALAASGTSTNTSATGKNKEYRYAPGTPVKVDVRATSLTNVSAIRLRLRFVGGGSLYWTITPSTINVWETKTLLLNAWTASASPMFTTAIDRWEIEIVATGGGSVTSVVNVDNIRIGSPLTWESSYDVRVRYKDAGGWGPFSAWNVLKVSQPPTVAQAVAIDNTDAAPTFDWTFTSPGGKAQASYRAIVYETATGSTVWDSGVVASSATVVTMPGFILKHATQYSLTLTAYDTDGLGGVWLPSAWTTNFTEPAALSTLTLTPSPSDSSVDLAWSATGLSASQFYSYRIYRFDAETGVYERIAEIFDSAVLTYTDREAPHRVAATYQVRQTNGYAESDPVQATTTLDLDYWITHPTDPTLVFPVPHVSGFDETFPVQSERYEPLDRPAAVVTYGQNLPPDGTITFLRLPSQDDPIPPLRRAQVTDPYVILKSPFGDVRRIRVGSIKSGRLGGGARSGSFDYTTIEA